MRCQGEYPAQGGDSLVVSGSCAVRHASGPVLHHPAKHVQQLRPQCSGHLEAGGADVWSVTRSQGGLVKPFPGGGGCMLSRTLAPPRAATHRQRCVVGHHQALRHRQRGVGGCLRAAGEENTARCVSAEWSTLTKAAATPSWPKGLQNEVRMRDVIPVTRTHLLCHQARPLGAACGVQPAQGSPQPCRCRRGHRLPSPVCGSVPPSL